MGVWGGGCACVCAGCVCGCMCMCVYVRVCVYVSVRVWIPNHLSFKYACDDSWLWSNTLSDQPEITHSHSLDCDPDIEGVDRTSRLHHLTRSALALRPSFLLSATALEYNYEKGAVHLLSAATAALKSAVRSCWSSHWAFPRVTWLVQLGLHLKLFGVHYDVISHIKQFWGALWCYFAYKTILGVHYDVILRMKPFWGAVWRYCMYKAILECIMTLFCI